MAGLGPRPRCDMGASAGKVPSSNEDSYDVLISQTPHLHLLLQPPSCPPSKHPLSALAL